MMTSIFSSFDLSMLPSSQSFHSLFYSLLPSMMYLQMLWVTPSSKWFKMNLLISTTNPLVNSTHSKIFKSFSSILTPTLYLIMLMNLWGMLPYILTMTSHLFTTLGIGAPMWVSMMSTSLIHNMKMSSAHFLPENTPLVIASFLSMVETLSSYIRPITLSFRLAANISAGHVILGMMTTASSFILMATMVLMLLPLPLIISGGYLMFEVMICLVQAFVFTLLSAMYSSDYTPKTSASILST